MDIPITNPGPIPGRLRLLGAEDVASESDFLEEHSSGAFRGFWFAMLFNILLVIVGGLAVWLFRLVRALV